MAEVLDIISNPWLVIVLICVIIALALYTILSARRRSQSESQENDSTESDTEIIKSISEKLSLAVTSLNQMDGRLESVETRFDDIDSRVSQAIVSGPDRNRKTVGYFDESGQFRHTAF